MSLTSKNIAVLISGGGTNLQAIIDNTKNNYINGNIKIVISNKKNAYGLVRAENNDLKAVVINDDDLLIKSLKENEIDLIVLAGYLKILPEKLTKIYENKIINIHPSLIPSFCGKGFYGIKVHEAVIKKGVRYTGATTHFVNEGADEGPIIMQKITEVKNENPEELQQKVLKLEHEILVESVKYFCEDKLKVVDGKVMIGG
ncbi:MULTISPECIES: phosphoribosylglycinamide formyltransferase [Peptoniphilus]|uniref:phosphoribosylglycinamide formyltransferase n=2 Tax=Peptoniphilaceae TaxID=1570339 RepID=UPI000B0A9F81|nr:MULTISPECIES: phosphoribosylglycinamide formyltransferase [Peptoniphilus]MDU1043354.1 phosphoribosylglycinamide formyltransferase [Peptoniphilus rhinitidis]MDU1954070.1 phosphoribosylglycinamide formyltransferase [Peptoniphilus lacydonensis]MDU2109904.1 phosphoribosylglycinamide formyltransferase [Peptoniphilus lacydonensis]MDU2115309.1 phosphoribosylglycinamide formyltransferase [Peptoniphilus lacydonensis]MDU3750289.1 phosphoribosylglycinamide formyltransferase [Peptoniphilus rhinitidis]